MKKQKVPPEEWYILIGYSRLIGPFKDREASKTFLEHITLNKYVALTLIDSVSAIFEELGDRSRIYSALLCNKDDINQLVKDMFWRQEEIDFTWIKRQEKLTDYL